MLTLSGDSAEVNLQTLISAIEDTIDEANLAALDPDTIREWEMRLATVCGALGTWRMVIDDPYREEHQGDEFGGKEGSR